MASTQDTTRDVQGRYTAGRCRGRQERIARNKKARTGRASWVFRRLSETGLDSYLVGRGHLNWVGLILYLLGEARVWTLRDTNGDTGYFVLVSFSREANLFGDFIRRDNLVRSMGLSTLGEPRYSPALPQAGEARPALETREGHRRKYLRSTFRMRRSSLRMEQTKM